MKISEMTLEQLQDYALKLEGEKRTDAEALSAMTAERDELRETNLMLQKRNNALFMQVEQSATPAPKTDGNGSKTEDEETKSVEDFALENMKGILNR